MLKAFRYFIIPNISKIFTHQIFRISKVSNFQQKTIITGNGKLQLGETCSFGYKLGGFHYGGSIEIQTRHEKAIIQIGSKVLTNNNVFICAARKIVIGDRTLIGQNVMITDHEAHGLHPAKRLEIGKIGEVQIGENVWIGNNVVILKNTKVGNNSVIAAGAVVSGTFPANVIIGGIPAKIIRKIND